jgi:hypothetical protein
MLTPQEGICSIILESTTVKAGNFQLTDLCDCHNKATNRTSSTRFFFCVEVVGGSERRTWDGRGCIEPLLKSGVATTGKSYCSNKLHTLSFIAGEIGTKVAIAFRSAPFKYGGTFSYESSLKRGPMSGNHWDLSISLPISITRLRTLRYASKARASPS